MFKANCWRNTKKKTKKKNNTNKFVTLQVTWTEKTWHFLRPKKKKKWLGHQKVSSFLSSSHFQIYPYNQNSSIWYFVWFPWNSMYMARFLGCYQLEWATLVFWIFRRYRQNSSSTPCFLVYPKSYFAGSHQSINLLSCKGYGQMVAGNPFFLLSFRYLDTVSAFFDWRYLIFLHRCISKH